MAVRKYVRYTLLFSFLLNLNCEIVTQTTCVYDASGGKVDLTPIVGNNVSARFHVTDENDEFEYLWNPCVPFSENYCQNAALCQITISSQWHVLMAPQDGVIQTSAEGPLELQFTGIDPTDHFTRTTFITLICDLTQIDNFTFQGEYPTRQYHFSLASKYACVIPNAKTTKEPTTEIVTTTFPPAPGPAPGPLPPIYSLKTITILLAIILVCLCVLNCMVFLGLITRSSEERGDNSETTSFTNHAFEKKPLN